MSRAARWTCPGCHRPLGAVRKRRQAIEDQPAKLHGLMVEIDVWNGGAVLDVNTHLSWADVLRGARRVGR